MSHAATRSRKPMPSLSPHPEEPETLLISAAVRRYGLSRSTLYRLAGKGSIDLIRAGGRTLCDVASIRRYLAACPRVVSGGSQ